MLAIIVKGIFAMVIAFMLGAAYLVGKWFDTDAFENWYRGEYPEEFDNQQ